MTHRIFLPKLTSSAQNKVMMDAYATGRITSCVMIERLKQPRNPYTPATIYTSQTQFFAPFQIFHAAHIIVREHNHYRVYDIPTQFLIPYNLANAPSRRVERYIFLNLPVDVYVGDQIFVGGGGGTQTQGLKALLA